MLHADSENRLPLESEEDNAHAIYEHHENPKRLPCIKGALQLFSPVCIAVI